MCAEFFDGKWYWKGERGGNPQAAISFSCSQGVWMWWANGVMGEDESCRGARAAAERCLLDRKAVIQELNRIGK